MSTLRKIAPFKAELMFPSFVDRESYAQWQVQQGFDALQPDKIRHGVDYNDFMKWKERPSSKRRRVRNKLSSINIQARHRTIASRCHHRLHPITKGQPLPDYCPVCDVQISSKYLLAITHAWKKSGGPWSQKKGSKNAETHGFYKSGWSNARLELASVTDIYHKAAEDEAQWDKMHGNDLRRSDFVFSATRAVAIATRDVDRLNDLMLQ